MQNAFSIISDLVDALVDRAKYGRRCWNCDVAQTEHQGDSPHLKSPVRVLSVPGLISPLQWDIISRVFKDLCTEPVLEPREHSVWGF